METCNPFEAPASSQGMIGIKITDVICEMFSLLQFTFATVALIAGWIHYDRTGHSYLFSINALQTIAVLYLAIMVNVKDNLAFYVRLKFEIASCLLVFGLVFMTSMVIYL